MYLRCSQEHLFWCLKAQPYYPPRTSAIHGCNPKLCARPGSWHRIVLTNPVRCCSAFAHTPALPTSLDSRCSALRPEPEASNDGQAIGSGQAAASIHRIHHSNERPVGGAKIGHAEEPLSAAGTALSPYYLSPPHACWRRKLLASVRAPTCSECPSRPPPAKERGKTAHSSPSMPCGSRWHFCKAKLCLKGMCQMGVKQAREGWR
jgi:hypothetical protein